MRLAAIAAVLAVVSGSMATSGTASAQVTSGTGGRAPRGAQQRTATPARDDFHYGLVQDPPHPPNPDLVSDSTAWLRERGITSFPKDEACWQTLPMDPPDYRMNACVCDMVYRIGGREILACSRFKDVEPGAGQPLVRPLVPGAQHLVMYDVTRGSMRLVLDQPISASTDNLLPSPVRLEVSATDTELLIGEHGGECTRSMEAFKALERDRVWGSAARPAEVIYSEVCASRGRYQLRGGRFVRVGDAPPVLTRDHPYPIT